MASSQLADMALWLDGPTYDAAILRASHVAASFLNVQPAQVVGGVLPSGGAMAVSAGSGMSVNVAAGYALCPSSTGSSQGGYLVALMAAANLTVQSADPANPRIDQVFASVTDNGNDTSTAQVQILAGTPAAGATLSNLNGAPAPPPNPALLASVRVPANATSITAGDIASGGQMTVAQGGILPVSAAAWSGSGYTGMYIHDLASGRLMHSPPGGNAQPHLLPFTPQQARNASINYTGNGALMTICQVSITTDGNTDIEVIVAWEGISPISSNIQVDGSFIAYLDSSELRRCRMFNTQSSLHGGGGFTHVTNSTDRPAAGSHTVSVQYTDNYGTTSNPTQIVNTLLYVRPVPL